jgi:hypothetical protein
MVVGIDRCLGVLRKHRRRGHHRRHAYSAEVCQELAAGRAGWLASGTVVKRHDHLPLKLF